MRSSPPTTPCEDPVAPGPGLRVHPVGHMTECRPESVILGPRPGVGQHVVGLGDLLEPLLGGRILVHVGVIGARQLAVGPLNLLRTGGPRNAQD